MKKLQTESMLSCLAVRGILSCLGLAINLGLTPGTGGETGSL